MNFLVYLLATFILMTSVIQPGMKHRQVYKLDSGIQSGVPFYDTGKGWMYGSMGKDKFAHKIVVMDEAGKTTWEKAFAYPLTSAIPSQGGALVLDERGNFYEISREGLITSNLVSIIPPGRNLITRGSGETIYASGGDDSITCFETDGNIEWVAVSKSTPMYMLSVDNDLIVSEKNGAIVRLSSEGDEVWRMDVKGFASNAPIILRNGNLVWGLRNLDGSSGQVIEITTGGKKVWETSIKRGAEYIYETPNGYLIIGTLHAAAVDLKGAIKWEQPFDGSKKLYPMGFNDDGRLVLGILIPDGSQEALKVCLLHPEGSITISVQIPVKKNSLVNVGRRGRIVLMGLKDQTIAYKLVTMQEYIDSMNK